MKRFLILLMILFTTDSLASGIASNTNTVPCTNNTLETYSGNSNLSADWQPNEIQLRWYNGNTLLDVQSSANTCVYDGALTIPQTAPNRTGYTFAGWQVRPEMDFSTIPTNEAGLERWSKGIFYDNTDYCKYDGDANDTSSATQVVCSSDNNFGELQTHEWKVRFSHGTVYGMSICTVSNGTAPTTEIGQYCWCKATGYKTNNQVFAPKYNLSWVKYGDNDNTDNCMRACSAYCTNSIKYSGGTSFRRALFTPASNN